MKIHLTPHDRQALVKASASHEPDAIERTIATIRARNPQAFHTEESLSLRTFVDQPIRDVPCRGFYRVAHTVKEAA